MKPIKAMIFDLDGTLLNTIEDIKYSCNRSLMMHGLHPFDTEDFKLMVGDGVDKLIERCLTRQNADIDLFDSVKKHYLDNYAIHQFDQTKPYEGMIELLVFAKEHGISCHVLSNKPHHDTLRVIEHFFEEGTFESVTGKKKGILPKPDPTLLKEILSQLHDLSTEEILYVGDTLTDMLTAENAGLNKVGVLWGFREEAELLEGHPEYIVKHPSEIISLLKREIL